RRQAERGRLDAGAPRELLQETEEQLPEAEVDLESQESEVDSLHRQAESMDALWGMAQRPASAPRAR
ncbi:unnamed protein product, partial [Prorocentrum cordatum]